MKKKVKGKKKTVKNKPNDNKKSLIIIGMTLLVIIIIITLIMMINGTKTITCVSEGKEKSGVKQDGKIVVSLKKEHVEKVMVTKKITIKENSDEINYFDAVKLALEDAYNKLGIKYKMRKEDNTLIVDLTYNKKQKYIIDNVEALIENGGIIINIVSNDEENNYSSIDLSKKYNNKEIMEIFEKNHYKCN